MTWVIDFFTTTAIGRTLAKIGAAVLLILSFGAYRHRQGVNDAKANRAAADAKAHRETTERVLHETASDDPADDIRARMRARAGKP